MKWLTAACAALPLAAQIQVFVLTPSGPQLAGSSVNLGSFATNEPSEIRFRATNLSQTETPLQTLSANGFGFSIPTPFQPVNLPVGGSYDFRVRFSPTGEGSYSGTLRVNAFSTVIRATAAPAPVIAITVGGNSTELSGRLQADTSVGQQLTLDLLLFNPHPTALTVGSLQLSGAGFRISDAPVFPLTLDPGARVPFRIQFSGTEERAYSAVLSAGFRRLELEVIVLRPRLPAPRIVPDSSSLTSGRQIPVRILFASPAPGKATGSLRVSFSGSVQDPAIQFMNGLRQISFEVAAGSQEATFDGEASAILQTGTSAGSLRLEAETESGVVQENYVLPPAGIVIDEAKGTRNGSNLEISISGFDNTRSAGSMNFRFFDRAGNPIGGILSADIASNFRSYFTQSALAGVFRLRAVFPVTGNASEVGSVLAEIANAVGRTDISRIVFP